MGIALGWCRKLEVVEDDDAGEGVGRAGGDKNNLHGE